MWSLGDVRVEKSPPPQVPWEAPESLAAGRWGTGWVATGHPKMLASSKWGMGLRLISKVPRSPRGRKTLPGARARENSNKGAAEPAGALEWERGWGGAGGCRLSRSPAPEPRGTVSVSRLPRRISQGSPQKQNQEVHIYIWKEIYYKILTHVIMEAEKPHGLPSASWRPREAGGLVQRPENQERCGQETIDVPAPQSGRRRADPAFLHLFVLCRPPTDWDEGHSPWGRGGGGQHALLILQIQMLISSETPPWAH